MVDRPAVSWLSLLLLALAAPVACGDDASPAAADAGRDAQGDSGPRLDGGPPPVDGAPPPAPEAGPPGEAGPDGAPAGGDAPGVERTFAPTDEAFPNPERGFYATADLLAEDDLSWVRAGGHTLVHSYVRLDDHRAGSLPESLLDRLDAGLGRARDAGIEVVLRFAYNFGPYPDSEPDAPEEVILGHIAQLEPVLRADADVIAFVQAGFIGAWGEWHTSTNDLLADPAVRRRILERLLDALPAGRSVLLRYPPYKEEMYGGPLDDATAFSGSFAARTGHHNDCFLASDTDLGTYPSDAIERWKSYLEADTRYVPMGGETCAPNPPRSECASALEEMARLHWSFVNDDYHEEVLAGWERGGCRAELERRLGYRLVLVAASTPDAVRPGGSFRLRVALANEGFAAPMNPRPVLVVLDGPARVAAELPVDVRRWLPGSHALEVRLRLPSSLPEGDYRLALALPAADPRLAERPEYAVRLANDGVWDGDGLNVLSPLRVADSAPGERVEDATTLELLP